MRNDPATATEDIASARVARAKLVTIADANATSMVVQIYTELDDNASMRARAFPPPNKLPPSLIMSKEKSPSNVDLTGLEWLPKLDSNQRPAD